MTFSKFSFLLHIYPSRRPFFVFIKISYLQPFREIMGDKEYENFRLKWRRRPKKWLFFGFFFLLHIYTSRRNFFVFIKISYLQPFREIMGGQRIRKFLAKMTPQGKKMTFFRIFFSVAHLHVETKLFCYYQNYISSAVQRNHGGTKKKRYIEQRRTTNNDERRTTLTMIIARQDSQNPRANMYILFKILLFG